MASRVKGITIQINGDTTGLDKALKSVNSTIYKTQSDLKDVNKLLKLDPGNTDLLAQKQRMLATAIDETKQKLETLKTAQQQAAQQLAEGRIGQEQYDALQREIAETEQRLRSFEGEADDTERQLREMGDAADDAAEDTGDLDVSLKSMIQNAAVNLAVDGLKLLADKAKEAAKYVLDVGSSFEAGMSKVAAVSGASAADMEQLSAKAKEMGATTKFSASEAADAMNYMAMAGWKTNDMLEGIEGIMNLAAASGEDLATTSDIVTDALTAFGETAEESGRLADIMAAASSNANTNVSMMGETFKYAAPVAGSLGASMEDTALAVGLMANSGIKASQAGTALRAGLTNLVKPSKQASDAMAKYGIEIQKNDDGSVNLRATMEHLREVMGGLSETEQAAAAGAIFGKNAMSGWLAIVNASDEDFNKLADAIDNSDGAAKSMAETMGDNLQGKVTIFQSALEGLGIALYEKVSGPLQDFVELATDAISTLTEAFSDDGPKDYVADFADEIEKANKETAKSIENARKTVEDAEARVGVLSGFETQIIGILDQCENFEGELDELGGKSTQIGYLEKAFDDTTESVKETYHITDEFTRAKMDVMVGELGDSVDGLSDAWDSQTGTLKASKKELKEWFDLARQVAMYEALQESIKEVTKAYGSAVYEQTRAQSGFDAAQKELDDFVASTGKTVEQLEAEANQFDKLGNCTSQQGQEYRRLSNNVLEMSENLNDANDNMDAAEKEYNDMQGVMSQTEEKLKTLGVLTEEEAEANEEARGTIDKKTESTEDNTEATSKNTEETESNTEATEDNTEATEESGKKTKEEKDAFDDSATSVSAMTEEKKALRAATKENTEATEDEEDALKKATDAAHVAADAQRTLRDACTEARDDMTKAFEDIQKSAESAFKVDAFGTWEQDTEKGMVAFIESLAAQRNGLLRYKDNITTVTEQLGETAPDFVQYLLQMGEGGAQLVAEIADVLRNGDPNAVYDMIAHWKEALDVGDEVHDIVERCYIEPLLGLTALTPEMITGWENLGYAFDEGIAVIRAKGGELPAEISDSFWQAVDAAKAVGAEVPSGLAESIISSEDPELAIQQATDAINESLRGRGQALVDAAKEMGLQIPAGIVETLNDPEATGEQLQAAVGQLVDSIKTKNPDFEAAGTEAGEAMADSTASGITDKTTDVEGSTTDLVNSAQTAGANAAPVFKAVGTSMMSMLNLGMLEKKQTIIDRVKANINAPKTDTTVTEAISDYKTIGSDAMKSLATGMSDAISTINSAMSQFVSEMNGHASNFVSAINQMKETTNFSWSLPNLEMPHPWTRGRFSIDPPEVPEFGVVWFAKAMQNGMILNKPTIFGMQGNNFLAGGEAGSETVVGTNSLMNMIQAAVNRSGASFGDINIALTSPVTDVKALARELEGEISKNIIRRSGRF